MSRQIKMSTLLLTGVPGIGKTTLIKKLTEELQGKTINFIGFYTEEVRNEQNQRIGFDIRTFDGQHSILARNSNNLLPNVRTTDRIGQYHIYLNNFNDILQPFIKSDSKLIVIDEIGSMELLSNLFQSYMENVTKNLILGNVALIATISLNNRRNNVIIDKLKNLDGSTIIMVTLNNRNQIYSKILEETMKVIKQ